jgi:hypothetical protein
LSSFIENLSIAIAVKIKALKVFPQDSCSDLTGNGKTPVEIVKKES